MALTLRYAVRSDRGLVRSNNEDSVYAGPRLLAIADGMGGHAAGEVASKLVITALEELDEDRPLGDLLSALREAVESANEGIAAQVAANTELAGMGTTLTALRFVNGQVGLAHVGDSRAYLMRGDQLSQITHDDTYVQSLVDAGRLTPDEAANHPRKSVILRALTGASVEPDVSIREARAGDRYLLCTDGLTDVVSTQTLFETLAEGEPQECADRLVELALRGGGPDNVTCIVADVLDSEFSTGFGDDVPVIGGAFVDVGPASSNGADTPAERAAAISRPAAPPPLVVRKRRRIPRGPLLAVLLVVLAIAASLGTYAWTQQQYFVGADGDEVAIFQGVDTQFGPLKFFSAQHHTDLLVDDLIPAVRVQVHAGITAPSRSEADQIVMRLRGQLMPLCSSLIVPVPVAPTPSDAPTSTPTPTSTSTTSTTKITAKITAKATGKVTAKSTTKTTGAISSTEATPSSSSPSPYVPPRTPTSPVPGQTCRAT
jgi:serine/threonine protein phosphatase PrpC